MRDDLMEILCCPACRGDLRLEATKRDEHQEIIEGTLTCAGCGHVYPIDEGIPNLLPPEEEPEE